MAPFTSDDCPQYDRLVHDAGNFREALADLDARYIGRDRLERTADFLGGFCFDFPHVLVRRTTTEEHVDHGLVIAARACCSFGAVDVGHVEAKSPDSQGADFQHAATTDAIAIITLGWLRSKHSQHGANLRGCVILVGPKALPLYRLDAVSGND